MSRATAPLRNEIKCTWRCAPSGGLLQTTDDDESGNPVPSSHLSDWDFSAGQDFVRIYCKSKFKEEWGHDNAWQGGHWGENECVNQWLYTFSGANTVKKEKEQESARTYDLSRGLSGRGGSTFHSEQGRHSEVPSKICAEQMRTENIVFVFMWIITQFLKQRRAHT